MKSENYDLEAVYDEKINPLMAQVIAICKEHKMPLLCSFQYAVTDAGTDDEQKSFCTTFLHGDRECKQLDRATDIIYNGLPENRAMAFTMTTRTGEVR